MWQLMVTVVLCLVQEPEGYRGAVMANTGPAVKDALERKRSYKEHREFLQSFQNYREVRVTRGIVIG